MPEFDAQGQLDALGQAVITTDVDGVVVYWNPAAEEMYGWSADEAVGRNIAALTVPDVDQKTGAEIMSALREGIPWSGGFPVRRKDGSMFPALVTDSGIYKNGRLVGIIGISTHLGNAVNPLLDRSTDAALVLRSDAVVTYASPAGRELFGWDPEVVMGSSVLPLLHPEDMVGLADFLEEVAARPGAHPPVELRVLAKGEWVWAEATLTNLLDDPSVRGFVANLRLSTWRPAQEHAEEKVAQLQTALDSRLLVEQAKGFLAGRHGVSPEYAFAMLRAQARRQQRTVQELARAVLGGESLSDLEGA